MLNYKSYLIILFVTLGISLGLQILLPFPFGLIAAIALFIAFPIFLLRWYMNRMRGYGGRSFGRGGSKAGGFFGLGSQDGSGGVKYVCLVCNNKHKGGSCPRCGSKMQRADF